MLISEILVPLLNANEPEARLSTIHVRDGQPVEKGTLLFTLETTKAAVDIDSPEAGYVRLLAPAAETLEVGELLALITSTADEPIAKPRENKPTSSIETGIRITKPARLLAEQLGVDLDGLPGDRLITETFIRQRFSGTPVRKPKNQFTDFQILIYGAGGHAKTVMEMVRAIGRYEIAGILDDNIPPGIEVLGIPVLGSRDVLPQLVADGLHLAANGVGGILNIRTRIKLFELLAGCGFSFPALIHPRAVLEASSQIGEGVQVFANAYIGSDAILGSRCMVNTGAVVSHDCTIGEYTHIAPGALLAGLVQVGARTLVGMGVTSAIGIHIGENVRIGNAAILYADVPDKTILPAGKIWGR